MIATERLNLRAWRADDAATFATTMNSPAVMAHLGGPVALADYEAARDRQQALQATHGHCLWIIERRADGAAIGFCGLKIAEVGPIAGDVEIGWRLREDAWGSGFAREAAMASLGWAWANLDAPRVIAMTVPANQRSWGLMARIGMVRRLDLDFGHPQFSADHPLHQHIVYAIDRPLGRAG